MRESSPRRCGVNAGAPPTLLITDVCFANTPTMAIAARFTQPPAGRRGQRRDAGALGPAAVVHARAGADMVAPSGMMDGMVGGIRAALDEAGFATCRS